LPQNLPSDKGEMQMIRDFAPDFFQQNFNGNIHEYNWSNAPLFVHIPRTGGNSIIETGVPISRWGHWNMKKIKQVLPRDECDNKFKFSFVRNPYDRIASAYFYVKNTNPDLPFYSVNKKYLPTINKYKDFNDFCLHLEDVIASKGCLISLHHQYDYLYDEDDNLLVDMVIKLEEIEKEWEKLCNMCGWERVPFPHQNKSIRPSLDNCYSEESKKIVADIYRKDFEAFKYDR
jgi:hypothetical protein